MGRHKHGGAHSSIELFYVDFNWNNLLKPGDIILCTRITNTNQILFGNGQILTPEKGIRNSAPTWLSFPFNINLPRNGTTTWEHTQPITWNPTNTSQARIAGVRVNNTTTGGIEIATSNPTASGPIYASQHASNNWESIPVGNRRVFTLLDEVGNTSIPGDV